MYPQSWERIGQPTLCHREKLAVGHPLPLAPRDDTTLCAGSQRAASVRLPRPLIKAFLPVGSEKGRCAEDESLLFTLLLGEKL